MICEPFSALTALVLARCGRCHCDCDRLQLKIKLSVARLQGVAEGPRWEEKLRPDTNGHQRARGPVRSSLMAEPQRCVSFLRPSEVRPPDLSCPVSWHRPCMVAHWVMNHRQRQPSSRQLPQPAALWLSRATKWLRSCIAVPAVSFVRRVFSLLSPIRPPPQRPRTLMRALDQSCSCSLQFGQRSLEAIATARSSIRIPRRVQTFDGVVKSLRRECALGSLSV